MIDFDAEMGKVWRELPRAAKAWVRDAVARNLAPRTGTVAGTAADRAAYVVATAVTAASLLFGDGK